MMCSGGETLHSQCATHLINYLIHPYPLVRSTTATKLYEALLTSPYFEEDEEEQSVSDVLLNTNWFGHIYLFFFQFMTLFLMIQFD